MRERTKELLQMASEKFKERSNPFETDVPIKYNVTFDECMGLSENISHAIDFFIRNFDLYVMQQMSDISKMAYIEINKAKEK